MQYSLVLGLFYIHALASFKFDTLFFVVPVDMIYEVRAGKSSAIFNEYGCDFREQCCFSIVIGSSFDSIDLVARTPEDAKIWIAGIRLLTRRGLNKF